MEAFVLYLIKSVIWLSGFTLIFLFFLRNERFFRLNRLYLIAGILTSFLFPFISIHYSVVLPVVGNIQSGKGIFEGVHNESAGAIPVFAKILLVIYLTGLLFEVVLIVRQIRSIIETIKKHEITTSHPVKLIRTAGQPSSFSFFSYVFVNPSVTALETEEIINHEMVHVHQMHWFDLLLGEVLCILQWFNPLVWIYIRFIKQNHEYLADEGALQRTSNPANYRATLLNQIVGSPVLSLSNSFNYSLNTKRFDMMKNIVNSPYRKMKILLILPVCAILLYSFAKPEYRYAVADENSSINGSAIEKYGDKGKDGVLEVTLIKKVSDNPSGQKSVGLVTGYGIQKANPPQPGVKIRYKGLNNAGSPPIIIVDGVERGTDLKEINISPNDIESFSIFKSESATRLYGEKAKNGIILIVTKNHDSLKNIKNPDPKKN